MAAFKRYYEKIRLPLRWEAEDHQGLITKQALQRIIIEHIGIDPRTFRNVQRALVLTGKLKPLNQHAFLFCDGKGEDTD